MNSDVSMVILQQTASGFYDMSTLAAGRESGMTSVAYSVSDARFARTDNNSSPVPSTLSQQVSLTDTVVEISVTIL
jgi:hypothetical protein